jgi:hypothetical protein
MTEFVGSRLKSQRSRGTAQDQTGSSTSDKSLPIIPDVAPPNARADAGGWQTRQLKGDSVSPHNVRTHPAMKARTASDGSPGDVLGSSPARPVKW